MPKMCVEARVFSNKASKYDFIQSKLNYIRLN